MTVFTTCTSGHDLTQEDAYIYTPTGLRTCRQCAIIASEKNSKRRRSAYIEPKLAPSWY